MQEIDGKLKHETNKYINLSVSSHWYLAVMNKQQINKMHSFIIVIYILSFTDPFFDVVN